MSRNQVAADLRQAERQVVHGARSIAHQWKVISRLEADGHPTTDARELLKTFEVMQRMRVTDRDRLTELLRAAE